MRVEFDKSFSRSLDKINLRNVESKVEKIILSVESADRLQSVRNIKKMTGYQRYYRIRFGDYRIGLELINAQTVRFIVIAHRKDIYDVFP